MYVDVHTHLTHSDFAGDRAEVIARATAAGITAIVSNGLDPLSNLHVLELAATYPVVKAACGIYPIDAVNHLLPANYPGEVSRFDVDAEIDAIAERARSNRICAVGECGLDGHWLGPETFEEQERVFRRLVLIAMECDLPVIIHTRKLEARAIEILTEMKPSRVNFHCFGGKVRLALAAAKEHGWYFSIPANSRVSQSFSKMLSELPIDRILTETDAPYLGPVRGSRNEPANVVQTISHLAELRNMPVAEAAGLVWENYQRLFSK